MRRGALYPAVLVSVAMIAVGPALAQRGPPASVPLPPEAPPRPAAPVQPTAPANTDDPQLERLAEIMGTLAFMRDLCGDGDGAVWHDKMAALIAAEGTIGARDEHLAGSYNRGFRGYQMTYRSCTDSARTVVANALEEGTRITRDIARRLNRE